MPTREGISVREVDSLVRCPFCKSGALTVVVRRIKDGTGSCWGECPECDRHVHGGSLRAPDAFDAEALVSTNASAGIEGRTLEARS